MRKNYSKDNISTAWIYRLRIKRQKRKWKIVALRVYEAMFPFSLSLSLSNHFVTIIPYLIPIPGPSTLSRDRNKARRDYTGR